MVEPIADDDLYARGVAALEDLLGPVEALRFLALISREPFDYRSWRDGEFAGASLPEILAAARRAH